MKFVFRIVKDQLSSSGFGFENPGEPQAVEWALARSKQHLVQASDPHERNRQPQSDAGEFGFMRATADVFAKPKKT